MSFRAPLAAAVLLVTASAVAAQTLPCQGGQAADPCVIGAPTSAIPAGVYDIQPRSLVVGNRQIAITAAGEQTTLEIRANNITFEQGARFVANTTGTISVTLDAAGALTLQSGSKVDVSGDLDAGLITLASVGDMIVNAALLANASNQFGFAGQVYLSSTSGGVTIAGEGIRASGGQRGGGGAIVVNALGGALVLSTLLEAKNGDCSGCEVSLTAATDLTSTAQGKVDMRASGIGDGGEFIALAEGNITLAGDVFANGSSDDFEGGIGGDIDIDAIGNVTIGGRIETNGAGRAGSLEGEIGPIDGDAGEVSITAGTAVQINAPLQAISRGFGGGNGMEIDGAEGVSISAEVNNGGDRVAGDIAILSDGLVTVSGRIRSSSLVVDPDGAIGGSIDVSACRINVTSSGEIIATGPDDETNVSGVNFLWGSTQLSVAGKVTATNLNDFRWRTTPPSITGMVTPAPAIQQSMFLPCCGVQCPATTTSTSSSTTTSSTSTSSTTAPAATTTSSTSTIIPTTTTPSSTSIVPTTTTPSSTSIAPTTTAPSSTTLVSTTTTVSSTTLASTTTTASSTTAESTTSTTSTTTLTTATMSTSTSSTTVEGATTTSSSSTTVPSSTTSSSTFVSTTTPTSSTTAMTSTTLASTSTTSVRPSTTSTTTTTVPLTCLDTALGIEAVRCRLGFLDDLVADATETELGGRKLARAITRRLAKATTLAGEPIKPRRLKRAARQLKQLGAKVAKGVAAGKLDPDLGADLQALVSEAQSELTSLATP